jgi:F420-dependent oxidoreductase-like protein
MKIGLQIIRFDWEGDIAPCLQRIATTADQVGFASLWVMDHLFQMGGVFGKPEAPMLEGYTTISYLAALTQHVKIGTLVTANVYRHPGLLVKMLTTIDVLSRGRAYLGIGAGWYEEESLGLGIPFPSQKERFERLEETLQITRHMWKADTTPFTGKYHQLAYPVNNPPPMTQPHPPILIGGEGEQKTFRLVAKYGDACNFYFGATPAAWGGFHAERFKARRARLTHKLNMLREQCDLVGRNYDEIEKTVLGTIRINHDGMSPSAVIDLCGELRELGFHHVIFNMPDTSDITPLEIMGREIIPVVSAF